MVELSFNEKLRWLKITHNFDMYDKSNYSKRNITELEGIDNSYTWYGLQIKMLNTILNCPCATGNIM